MTFVPSRRLGMLLGMLWLILLLGATATSVVQLSQTGFSTQLLLWVILPVVCVPLALFVMYRMYGLTTARYHLDRDGFALTWGLDYEQIPMAEIQQLQIGEALGRGFRPSLGLWWPGCMVGDRDIAGIGRVEFYATQPVRKLALLTAGGRHLAISPADLAGFRQAFVEVTRLGPLERISEQSFRPNFIFTRIWKDRLARILILTGLLLPLGLMAFLSSQANRFPEGIVFGYSALGIAGELVPTGRMLLLPLIGILSWVGDFILGFGLYRQEQDQPLAYFLWAVAIVSGGLLWGASFMLISTTRTLLSG